MLGVGDPVPESVVFAAPGEPLELPRLADSGVVLFLFYLFDWSGT